MADIAMGELIATGLLILVFLGAALYVLRAVDTVTWLVLIRVPAVFGLVLLVAPWFMPKGSLTNNLLILDNWWQAAIVFFFTFLLAHTVVFSALLILRHAPIRMGARVPAWVVGYSSLDQMQRSVHALPYVLLLTVPMVVVVSRKTLSFGQEVLPALILAGAAAVTILGALEYAETLVLRAVAKMPRRIWKLLDATLGQGITSGYLDRANWVPYGGHLRALGGFSLLVLGYVVFAWVLNPADPLIDHIPAFAFVLFLCVLLLSLLAGASFFFDRYRIPVIVVMLAVGFVARIPGSVSDSSDHYFKVLYSDEELSRADPAVVLERLGPQEDGGRCAVVVCAFGGGIQAAAWTSNVLTRVHEAMEVPGDSPTSAAKPRFANSLSFISSVSGGSVGTMHYLEAWRRRSGDLEHSDFEAIRRASTKPSLSAAFWGLVFQDMRRSIFFYPNREMDRAVAMEEVWRRSLDIPCADEGYESATLGLFSRLAGEGRVPGFAMNATVAETGRRFLFSNVEIESRGLRCSEAFDARVDIRLSTAARLSAAFPYVSPLARADDKNLLDGSGKPVDLIGIHFGDGGYFDVGGVVTAVEWIMPLLKGMCAKHRGDMEAGVDRIALVLIPAFGGAWEGVADGSDTEDLTGCDVDPTIKARSLRESKEAWRNSVIGPLELLFRSRTGTQCVRGALEVDALLEFSNAIQEHPVGAGPAKRRLHVFAFPPPLDREDEVLSWHLSKDQARKLQASFEQLDAQAATEHDDHETGSSLKRRLERLRAFVRTGVVPGDN